MGSLRILLALLIALSLPAQALANLQSMVDCCPASAEHEASEGHACCEHDNTPSGHACESDSGCHCSSQLALAMHRFLPAVREGENASADFLTQPHPAPPDPHWRPPAPHPTVT